MDKGLIALLKNIPALRKSLFYYFMAGAVICGLINFSLISTLRLRYLRSLYLSVTAKPDKNVEVLLYDYVAHLDPQGVDGWIGLARSSLSVGDEAGAIGAYQKAIRLQPRQQQHYAELADVYRKRRQDKKAAAVLNSYLRRLP